MPPMSEMEKSHAIKSLALIKRGCGECIGEQELADKIRSGKTLRVKVGFDPTAPDLHLGHAVLLAKMRQFQELGHTAIFLIGDFTAAIGDPSGQNAARPPLSQTEIEHNAKTYDSQVFKILLRKKTEVRRNSEWMAKMSAADLIHLAAQETVARMLERDDFHSRFRNHISISIHEFLYPLVQGYDSVALNADVELGGTDQKFNLLVGRELQRHFGQSPQSVLTMPLLEGLDGVRKMSKSLGNAIGIDESAGDIFGKAMSLSDSLMWRYFELLSLKSADEISELKKEAEAGRNPKEIKAILALELSGRFAGEKAAAKAALNFESQFSRREVPDEIPQFEFADELPLANALKESGLASSNSEARRKIKEGAVKIDGEKIMDEMHSLKKGRNVVAQLGRRKFARIVIRN